MRYKVAGFLLIVCGIVLPVRAHHVSAGPSGNRIALAPGMDAKPLSRAYSFYDVARLDEGVGESHVMTIGGEYSFTKRVSAGMALPFSIINHRFRAQAVGVGDVSVMGKALLWEGAKTFAFVTTSLSLPTGASSEALGRGALGQESSFFLGLERGRWSLHGLLGISFGYEAESEPILLPSFGVSAPRFLNDRMEIGLDLSAQMMLASDVLNAGSAKLFLQPRVSVTLDGNRRWIAGLSSRVSVLDTFTRKPGVTIANTSLILLNDVLYGVTAGVDFNFK